VARSSAHDLETQPRVVAQPSTRISTLEGGPSKLRLGGGFLPGRRILTVGRSPRSLSLPRRRGEDRLSNWDEVRDA